MPIGIDEWVAQPATGASRHRAAPGATDCTGLAWWQRLALAALVGVAFGLTDAQLNVNSSIEQVGSTASCTRSSSLGLNIAAGWAGLLDLGYIAFFGFGAYGYASSRPRLSARADGGAHWRRSTRSRS